MFGQILTNHLRLIFNLYRLPNPLLLLTGALWPKEKWTMVAKTAVLSHHEAYWRLRAENNSKLKYLNVKTIGLSGRPHPVLAGVHTTQEVKYSRVHIKMLSGDYLCFSHLGKDRKQSPHCRLCKTLSPLVTTPDETMMHLLTRCRATSDVRTRILPDLLNVLAQHLPENQILQQPTHEHLTQFILDPTSLNLPVTVRISPKHTAFPQIIAICRRLCFFIHKSRSKQLQNLDMNILQ